MKWLWIALFLCVCSFELSAAPAQVLLIRHAEKPPSGNGLSVQGFERAAAFVPYFCFPPQSSWYNIPNVCFAMCTSTNHQTTRCTQTVAPLAQTLGIELIAQYTFADYKPMCDLIMKSSDYDGKTVLICWAHENLGPIAGEFGVTPAPVYPSGVYDRLWVLDFSSDGKLINFQDLSQQLMYGDTDSTIYNYRR